MLDSVDDDIPSFKVLLFTVLIMISAGIIATDLYLPSFPAMKKALNTSSSSIQLSLTIFLFTFAGSQLLYGPLSDKYGRKKIALFSLFSSMVGTIICFFAVDISMLFLGRALQGLSLGAGSTIARAIMRDVYSGDKLAYFGSFVPIGTSVLTASAPVIGGYIERYLGWRMNFLIIIIYSIVGIFIIYKWLPETNKNLNPNAMRQRVFMENYLHLLKSPIFIGYAVCGSLAFGGLAAYLTASPYLFQETLGLTPIQYGWLGFILGVGVTLGGFLNGRLLKKLGRHRMLVLGVMIMGLGSFLMLIFALLNYVTVFGIIFPMSIYTLGCAPTFANAFAGAFHPFAKIAGFAGALYGGSQIMGGSLITLFVAGIHERNQLPLGIILTVISICAYLSQYMAFKVAIKSKHH